MRKRAGRDKENILSDWEKNLDSPGIVLGTNQEVEPTAFFPAGRSQSPMAICSGHALDFPIPAHFHLGFPHIMVPPCHSRRSRFAEAEFSPQSVVTGLHDVDPHQQIRRAVHHYAGTEAFAPDAQSIR